MITLLTIIAVLVFVGLILTLVFSGLGLLFSLLFWVGVKLPLAIILFAIGTVFCCTIIFIPIGLGCMKHALRLLFPARILA